MTFVAESVNCDYTCGIVVVEASSLKEAIKLVNENEYCYHKADIIRNLRILNKKEVISVHGGVKG